MSWRYQPVYMDDASGRFVGLIEAYFDDQGNFTSWTEGFPIASGETVEELASDLHRMIVDALSWQAAPRDQLKPGYVFEPRVSMEERRDLVDFVGQIKDAMNRRTIQKPQPN